MNTDQLTSLRNHLAALLEGGHAYARPETIVAGIPADVRGTRPNGVDHSPWELLEHLRIAQRDMLDFSVAPTYEEIAWPKDYWPATPAPPNDETWDESVAAFLSDLDVARRLAVDEGVDLFAVVPHGTTQTYLRELLLIADHNAHHLGQLILVRKLLKAWP
ncbi:MAG TPA: DinB family protein [Candidatus Kapabacteria bacterium]|jgi:hypothetical protein|nr:DinB family protein [Candidatus Kapabacteria bacterium]